MTEKQKNKSLSIKDLFVKIYTSIKNYRHPIIKLLGFIFVILIIINAIYYFASSYSPICLTCHYMKPYYEQSMNSVHKNISCVTCHPNRRILTAPYFLKYISGFYNPRPRAKVDDKICLDCHEAQNLKKNTAFEMNISFNHSDHLEDLKRGKKLRCTSCHAHGEQEQHFTINKNVCFTCHFKGAERGHSITNCNVCHGIPRKTVEHGGFQFNHESYIKIGVDCSQCHLDVTSGNAEVSKKNCYKCHVERIDEISNVEKIHNNHITKQGIDCEECHNEIKHGKIKMISTLEANCENCHQLKHSLQREMYIGSEGRGVGSIPSRMFAAQVACEGCHVDLNNDGKSELSEKRQACVKCHSAGYDLMLDKWISGMNEAVETVAPSLEYARNLINAEKQRGKNIDAELNYFQDAEKNFLLVKEGKGVHNLDYALKLIENISNNIEGIAQRLGAKDYKVKRSKLLTDDREYCNLCHSVIKNKDVEKFGEDRFPHDTHSKFLACTKCHSKAEHKKITVVKSDCESCHKNFSKMPDNIKFGQINFPHSLHSKKRNIECSTCHSTSDFSKIQIKKNACTNCHHKDKELMKSCAKCHPTQNNTFSGLFIGGKYEQDIMKAGGVTCDGCHISSNNIVTRNKQDVCKSCHDASYQTTLNEWKNDISTKVKTLKSLIENAKKQSTDGDKNDKIDKAKKLISTIQSDGSKGIHNYMTLSEQLDKSIKELK